MCCAVSFFFFFKQKTAYEMVMSDWSSDVCSSDLARARLRAVWPAPGVWPAEADGLRRAVGRGLTGDAGIDAGAAGCGALEARPPGGVHAALLDLGAVLRPAHRVWSHGEHEERHAEASTRDPQGSRNASHGLAPLAALAVVCARLQYHGTGTAGLRKGLI